jgi:hypothetical protein
VRWGVVAALVLLVAATHAHAAVTRKKAMWGPAVVDGRSQFPVYADLGVGIWETALGWDAVEPTRGQYAWPAALDAEIAEAARYGIQVSVSVSGAPRWANGGRAANYAPTRPAEFAAFVAAAARRYPAVHHWLIWGEPTKGTNFRPLKGAAVRYARLLDAAYGALKRVDRRNLVIGGNTFTVGTVTPKRWIQTMRLPNGRKPRMDLFGHNPFSARKPDLRAAPLGRGYADFSDLDELAGWLDRYQRKGLRLFLSEFSLPTGHANWEFNFWMTPQTQADWLTAALKITRRWPRIYTLGYLGLYDDPVRDDGRQVERGLLERDGTKKPAYAAFARG